jgi:peptidoglycan/LPS O-acetylase OafA/YrhL
MKYRPEIDGLRSVAVLPVIMFHAGFDVFSGGFVGVDIFFVISGYLITTIIINDIQKKQFSLTGFYERRARRILPALFFVMILSLPFAWYLMPPDQLNDFSLSLVAVSLFVSNFLFWRQTGYFDAAAEEKPFLHTWSLAVEEQFYLIFPIFLMITWRLGRNRVFFLMIFLFLASFLLSEWGWRNKPIPNFYFPVTRFWELLTGSISAYIIYKDGVKSNNILSFFGLILILLSIFVYDKDTPFPSFYGLMPVVGAALIIVFSEKTIVSKILSTKILVYIGLVSYSAYLWHYPIFAFWRVHTLGPADLSSSFIFLFLIFLLAALTWRFIETPFRKARNFKRKIVFLVVSIWMVIFTVIGAIGYLNNGFIDRFGSKNSLLYEAVDDWGYPGNLNKSDIEGLYVLDKEKPINILFIGDSHADQFAPIASDISNTVNMNVGYLSKSGCPPIPGVMEDIQLCNSSIFDKLQLILKKEKHIKTIIISTCFNCYFIKESLPTSKYNYYYKDDRGSISFRKEEGRERAFTSLKNFIEKLSSDYKVILIGDNPSDESFNPKTIAAYNLQGDLRYFSHKYPNFSSGKFKVSSEIVDLNNKLLDLSKESARFLNSLEIVCPEGLCESSTIKGVPYYKDDNHMRPFFIKNKFKDPIIDLL